MKQRQSGQDCQQDYCEWIVMPEYAGHGCLSEFNFCKANIILVQAWHDDLSQSNLFAVFGHEIIFPVEVFQGRLPFEFSFCVYASRVEQQFSFFLLVEQEPDLISSIEKLIG